MATKDVLKSILTNNGEASVIMSGVYLKLMWFVVSWDIQEHNLLRKEHGLERDLVSDQLLFVTLF